MDRFRALEVFVNVVEEGSFAGAAKALSMSRNMASRHVADLEAHLSVRLLNRTTRSLSVTSTGQAYYEKAREILARMHAADAEAGLHASSPAGRLVISAPVSFGVRHISPYLTDFLSVNPRVRLELVLNDRMVDLVDEGFDLAIRVADLPDSSLISRRLASVHLIACASPSYVARHGEPGSPGDLKDHRCLGYSLGARQNVWTLVSRTGRQATRIDPLVWINNGDAIQEMVLAGGGIALQPDFIAGSDIAAGRLVHLLPGWTGGALGVHAVYADRRYMPASVRSFIDWLATLYRPLPPWARS